MWCPNWLFKLYFIEHGDDPNMDQYSLCPNCEQTFTSIFHQCHDSDHISDPISQDIQTHLKTHSGEKPNKCKQCDYASSEAGDLRKHLETHSGEKLNKCNTCDFASYQTDNLRAHLKMHSGEKSNKCNHIGLNCLGWDLLVSSSDFLDLSNEHDD